MLSWEPKTGNRAAKLELCDETHVYSFVDSSNHLRYQCQHKASTPKDDQLCTTDCAVLCYYRLYFSPFLRGVVSPDVKKKTAYLLTDTALRAKMASRVSGQSVAALMEHIYALGFPKQTPEELYLNHCMITLPSLLPLMEQPRERVLCPKCHLWILVERTIMRLHRKACSTQLGTEKVFVVPLWRTTVDTEGHRISRFCIRVSQATETLVSAPLLPRTYRGILPGLEPFGLSTYSALIANCLPLLQTMATLPDRFVTPSSEVEGIIDTLVILVRRALRALIAVDVADELYTMKTTCSSARLACYLNHFLY